MSIIISDKIEISKVLIDTLQVKFEGKSVSAINKIVIKFARTAIKVSSLKKHQMPPLIINVLDTQYTTSLADSDSLCVVDGLPPLHRGAGPTISGSHCWTERSLPIFRLFFYLGNFYGDSCSCVICMSTHEAGEKERNEMIIVKTICTRISIMMKFTFVNVLPIV